MEKILTFISTNYDKWVTSISIIMIGVFAGIAHHLHQHVAKNKPLSFKFLIINMFISAFTSWIGVELLPESMNDWKYALAGMFGYLAYPILNFIESDGLGVLLKKFKLK